MTPRGDTDDLDVEYFDGHGARAHAVRLRIEDGRLRVEGEDGVLVRELPLARLSWPERTRHGARVLHLPGGGSLHCRDSAAWDAWSARVAGRRDPVVVRLQQRWRWAFASLLAVALLLAVGYRWGLPLAARVIVSRIPEAVDIAVGDAALATIDQPRLVGPSRLGDARQAALRTSFANAVAHLPEGTVPRFQLEFRHGDAVGANAFALPGGAIVLTDELVERVHGDPALIVGVLGHELGHLRHRHGMRLLVQVGVLGAATSALYGDFSSLLALVPTWLARASYSRDAEREADVESVRVLRANGLSPRVMARFFVLVREAAKEDGGGDAKGDAKGGQPAFALASHPADAERMAFFERAAAQP